MFDESAPVAIRHGHLSHLIPSVNTIPTWQTLDPSIIPSTLCIPSPPPSCTSSPTTLHPNPPTRYPAYTPIPPSSNPASCRSMQDHREKRAFGAGKAYMFMMRTRQPAGAVTNQLYLAMDDLADQFGNGTLRLTTRQAYQLHGVLKHDLKSVFRCDLFAYHACAACKRVTGSES